MNPLFDLCLLGLYLRSARADIAEVGVLRHFAPYPLHSVIHRLGVFAEALCDILVGKPVEIEIQNLDLKPGQAVSKGAV